MCFINHLHWCCPRCGLKSKEDTTLKIHCATGPHETQMGGEPLWINDVDQIDVSDCDDCRIPPLELPDFDAATTLVTPTPSDSPHLQPRRRASTTPGELLGYRTRPRFSPHQFPLRRPLAPTTFRSPPSMPVRQVQHHIHETRNGIVSNGFQPLPLPAIPISNTEEERSAKLKALSDQITKAERMQLDLTEMQKKAGEMRTHWVAAKRELVREYERVAMENHTNAYSKISSNSVLGDDEDPDIEEKKEKALRFVRQLPKMEWFEVDGRKFVATADNDEK